MSPEGNAPLLLDTHVWLWLIDGAEAELSRRALHTLQRGSRSGELLVSVISVWELAMLQARSRIRLTLQIDEWVHRALRAPGVRLAHLDPEIAIESTRLPGDPHGDPADRILLATARKLGAQFVTRDARILAYARHGYVSTLDVTP